MPKIALLPFRAPAFGSVRAQSSVISPAVEESHLSTHWDRMTNLHLRAEGSLHWSFWSETGIERDEPVFLSFTAVCRATKKEWNARAVFEPTGADWAAGCELELAGGQLAGECELRIAVVGTGRTGSPHSEYALHRGAKLWTAPVKVLRLEASEGLFPVTAVSFGESRRRPLIWAVEETGASGPSAHVSEALRLYVNSDLEEGLKLARGEAPEALMSAVRSDIRMRTLSVLSGFYDERAPEELQGFADSHPTSISAMGALTAEDAGMSLGEIIREFRDDPLTIQDRIRARNHYLREGGLA